MAKSGERQSPPCPQCGHRLRIKPGTTRLTPQPLWQCRRCLEEKREEYEWTPAMVRLLNETQEQDQ